LSRRVSRQRSPVYGEIRMPWTASLGPAIRASEPEP